MVKNEFSRLLMDRNIFLGVPVNDDVTNIIEVLKTEKAQGELDSILSKR